MQSWAATGAFFLGLLGCSPHTGIVGDLKEGAPKLLDVLQDFCSVNNTLRIPIMCFFELHETDYGKRFHATGIAKGLVGHITVVVGMAGPQVLIIVPTFNCA